MCQYRCSLWHKLTQYTRYADVKLWGIRSEIEALGLFQRLPWVADRHPTLCDTRPSGRFHNAVALLGSHDNPYKSSPKAGPRKAKFPLFLHHARGTPAAGTPDSIRSVACRRTCESFHTSAAGPNLPLREKCSLSPVGQLG